MYQSSQSERDPGPSGSVPQRTLGPKTVRYSEDSASEAPLLHSSVAPPPPLTAPRIFRQPSINQGYMDSSSGRPAVARQESRNVNIDQSHRINPIAGTSDWRSFSFSGQFSYFSACSQHIADMHCIMLINHVRASNQIRKWTWSASRIVLVPATNNIYHIVC